MKSVKSKSSRKVGRWKVIEQWLKVLLPTLRCLDFFFTIGTKIINLLAQILS